MQTFLVETYVPRSSDLAALSDRLRAAARALSREGLAVRHVRATALPSDETCFHVFLADSEETIAEACRRAGLGSPRIVPAVEEPG